jgi:hypothetical protein
MRADQLNEEGCIQLYKAFWKEVHLDLGDNLPSAVRFVEDPNSTFNIWCHMAGADPEEVREDLKQKYPVAFERYAYMAEVAAPPALVPSYRARRAERKGRE